MNRKTKSLHILLTGSGFDLRHYAGTVGMPPTPELLQSMGPPFGLEPLVLEPSSRGRLPLLANASVELRRCADEGNLDRYWNLLLEGEDFGKKEKIGRYERELSMREAFYRAVLKFDKGYLAQSIIAASLNWGAWITSSFARFSDRAIELQEQKQSGERSWRKIGDSGSAEALTRLTLVLGTNLAIDRHKYLFRLRGDVTSIPSMSLAGYDKELFSPLAFHTDAFYKIYLAGTMLIQEALKGRTSIVWHIVGQSLMEDGLLLDLIAKSSAVFGRRATFIVVSRVPLGNAQRLRRFFSSEGPTAGWANRVFEKSELPFDYMCRVEKLGLPVGDRASEIEDWLGAEPGDVPSEFCRWALRTQDVSASGDDMPGELQSCFLSHSSSDKRFCDRLYQDLKKRGVRCWYFPEDAVMGSDLWAEIDRNIKDYDRLIVVLSANSVKSGPVLREIERALRREDVDMGNILFPIAIDKFVFEGWKSPKWSDIFRKVVGDFTDWETDEEKYQSSLRKLLKGLQGSDGST